MTTTLNAPPDQINGGLTLGDGTTLNVGEGGTVSGIAVEPGAVVNVNGGAASNITVNGTFNHGQFVGGTINVNGGTVSGSAVNGTLNLKDGSITGTTLNDLGTLNLSGGTAVNTLIIDTGTINVSGGIIDGISFDLSPNQSSYELQLNDFSSLQGPLGFDAPGFHSEVEGRYKVSLDFKHEDPSASVTLTRQTQTITIDYGQNQSVTYHYTTNKFTSVTAVQLLHENHQIELIVDVRVEEGPAPAFSAQSAATLVYTAEFGSVPDATELNVLNQFTQVQFAYGQQIGVQDPEVYAFESLGVALASSGQQFQNKFGPSNSTYPASTTGDGQFVTDAYTSVFGHAGSAAQVQHFVDQLNFFETLYTAAGTFGSASNIDLLARGAVYGQMLGIEHESALIGNPEGGTTFTAPPDQNNLVLNSGDVLNINNKGSAFSTNVNTGGIVNVNDGGQSFATTLNGGLENVNDGGNSVGTTIKDHGIVNVNHGGMSVSTVINSGGISNVGVGGSSQASAINTGGVENVSGSADHTNIDGGTQHILSGGTATNINISEGLQIVDNGGISVSPEFTAPSTIDVLAGGQVDDVTFFTDHGVLKMNDPSQLSGTILLQAPGQSIIDFTHAVVTSFKYKSEPVSLLTVTYGDNKTAEYAVGVSQHLAMQPLLQADGSGGTELIMTTFETGVVGTAPSELHSV